MAGVKIATIEEKELTQEALKLGKDMMDSSRKSNRDFFEKNPDCIPSITEIDYLQGEDEVAITFLKYEGIKPNRAKELVKQIRAANELGIFVNPNKMIS